MKSLLVKIIIAPLIFIGSFFHHQDVPVKTPNVGVSTLPINGSTYTLAGSGVTSSATSFTLSSLTIPQNGYKIQDSDASATFYMTLEPGSRSRQEVVSCTTILQNAAGTATISGCTRGLSPVTPYTASTTLQFAHPGGSQVIFGDAAQLFNEYTAKGNDETITGSWTFPYPTAVGNPATKAYADQLAFNGVATSTETSFGGVWLATQLGMASSTYSSNAPAVLYSRYSTSSPSTVCGLCVPITRNDGKLSPLFIATTSSDTYNFGGNVTLATTTAYVQNVGTINATSSIKINGVSLRTTPLRMAFTGGAVATVFSGAAAATTSLLTIPAGSMTASSTIQFFSYIGDNAGSANTCTANLRTSAGTNIASVSFANAGSLNLEGLISGLVSFNSVTSQSASIAGTVSNINAASAALAVKADTTSAVDFTNAITLVIQTTTTNSSSVICSLSSFSIQVNP